jgi:hypothetical protein
MTVPTGASLQRAIVKRMRRTRACTRSVRLGIHFVIATDADDRSVASRNGRLARRCFPSISTVRRSRRTLRHAGDVVDHDDRTFALHLADQEARDLVEYVKSRNRWYWGQSCRYSRRMRGYLQL